MGQADPDLKTLATMASASVIGCGSASTSATTRPTQGLRVDKLREVPRWRESDVFDSTERLVLEFAEALTVTPPEVTDELVERLNDLLGVPAVVELAMMVAVENERSRFNSAFGLTSQDSPTVASCRDEGRRGHGRRVRAPSTAAVHDRLRDAGQYGGRGGRAPGELAEVGRRGQGRRP